MAWRDFFHRAVRFVSGSGTTAAVGGRGNGDAGPRPPAPAPVPGKRSRAPARRRAQGSAAAGPAPARRAPAPSPGNATIVAREHHVVSRKQISNNALRVLYRLRDSGFQSYLVGGAVRDMLLGIVPKDFDVATDARPEEIRQLFRNCRLIGRRFRLAHIHYGQEIIEVATFRGCGAEAGEEEVGDRELANGRLLRDNVYGSLEEDIFRRDFTANALYYNIADFSIRDEVDGVGDIAQRRLRLIGDPEARFREDPVRMLRAVRFAAKLGFTIDPDTAVQLPRLAPLLAEVPPARLFDECSKLLLLGHAERSFELLRSHGLLKALMPQVAESLDGDDGVRFERFVRSALANSDERVREGKPLTSGFLLAVLLWPQAWRMQAHLVEAGAEPMLAWQRAADAVVGPFCRRVAIPRRISLVTLDIWSLQHWLPQRNRRRVTRLLGHPRFRAAWDFLLLRARVEPELVELVDWWRQAQALEPERLDQLIDTVRGEGAAEGAPRRKRRRGGRRRRGTGGGDGAPARDGDG